MKSLLPILLILLAVSCKTRYVTQEVPIVVEHTTTENHTEWRTDTLFHKDSVFVYQQGETLREVRYIERWCYRDHIVSDTVRDTIPTITTIESVEVRQVNVLKWWQKCLMLLGCVSVVFLILKLRKIFW